MLYWKGASKTQVKGFNIMVMIFQPQGKGFPVCFFCSVDSLRPLRHESPSYVGGSSHPLWVEVHILPSSRRRVLPGSTEKRSTCASLEVKLIPVTYMK